MRKERIYFLNDRFDDHDVNFWPGFIDVFVSILMIFIFTAFVRLLSNPDAMGMLEIQVAQNKFTQIFSREFSQEIKSGKVKIQSNGNIQQITFSSEILFGSGDANLSPRGHLILKRLVLIFDEALKMSSFRQIQVEGHTDNVPISPALRLRYPSNWELSSQRAISVVRYFITFIVLKEVKLLKPELFSGTGYSCYKPVASNAAEPGRSLNRRIEIRLVYFSKQKFDGSGTQNHEH